MDKFVNTLASAKFIHDIEIKVRIFEFEFGEFTYKVNYYKKRWSVIRRETMSSDTSPFNYYLTYLEGSSYQTVGGWTPVINHHPFDADVVYFIDSQSAFEYVMENF